MRARQDRGVAIILLVAFAVVAACNGEDSQSSPSAVGAGLRRRVDEHRSPSDRCRCDRGYPMPSWALPRNVEAPGVLVLDYGPIEGRSAGRSSGALYPLAAGSGATLPGKSAWRTAAGVRWPWRSTSQAWL